MFRTHLLFSIVYIFCALGASGQKSAKNQKKQPNFLFIAIDDLNTFNTVNGDLPGLFLEKIYPDATIRAEVIQKLTPNLDAFSKNSISFSNAYCASPLCGPSRTALLTGVPNHISHYYSHEKSFRHYSTLKDVNTLPQTLRNNGYFTAGIGKIFHKPAPGLDQNIYSDWPDRLFSWDQWVDAQIGTFAAQGYNEQHTITISKYFKNTDASQYFKRFGTTTLPANKSNDYVNAQFIADVISNKTATITNIYNQQQSITLDKKKPWFLACGIFAPHLPWVVPQSFYDRFPLDQIKVDRQLFDWIKSSTSELSPTGTKIITNSSFTELINYGLQIDGTDGDINAWKTYIQAYLATTAFADYCLQTLFEAIENNPQKSNTIVVLWSDHGYHLGDKNMVGKTTLWEASNHCNLIIHNPLLKSTSINQKVNAGVSLQDIYPTILSMANIERPSHVHGYDLTPLLTNTKGNWAHPVLSTYEKNNHTIRTENYRYIRFENGDKELYDLKNDPFETINMANKSEFSTLTNQMDSLLNSTLNLKPNSYNQY